MNGRDLGVALTKCFYCGEDGDILMNSILTKQKADQIEEMHGKVVNRNPCGKCQGYMKDGIIVISIDEEKSIGDMNSSHCVVLFLR